MKKMFFVLFLILLAFGCESREEYFDKICTKKIKSFDLVDTLEEKVIYNNKDEIIDVQVIRKYESKNKETINYVKKSINDYNNDLLESKNIKIKIMNDEDNVYSLKYFYDVSNMQKDELDNLNINKNSIKYLRRLKNEDFDCR